VMARRTNAYARRATLSLSALLRVGNLQPVEQSS
jgi:hypothetical protein